MINKNPPLGYAGRSSHHGTDKPLQVKSNGTTNNVSDAMHLDDTKDKVYIHDLDSELAELEHEENNIAFLPEIEKKLMGVPDSVLSQEASENNALVLYQIPSSLSVPESKDSVRRAIIETRHRAREEASRSQEISSKADHEQPAATCRTTTATASTPSRESDVMDIDDS